MKTNNVDLSHMEINYMLILKKNVPLIILKLQINLFLLFNLIHSQQKTLVINIFIIQKIIIQVKF